MTRVLVTGAQGFIGRAVVAEWLVTDPDATIVGLGRSERDDSHFTHRVTWRNRQWPAPTPGAQMAALGDARYQYIVQDLGDTVALTRLLAQLRPQVVVHLAASLRDDAPGSLVRNNLGAVVSLIESTIGAGIPSPRFLFGSSGSVYGAEAGRPLPVTEDTECRPIDPYSVTKLAAEHMSRVLCGGAGIGATWARIFNPLGPGQDERHLCGFLGQQVAAIVAGHRPPQITIGPLDTTRDFIDIADTAAAIHAIATRGRPGRIYNVGTGVETSGQVILDTALEVAGLTGQVEIIRRESRPADLPRHFAAVQRLAELGVECRRPLEASLRDVIDYYLGPVEELTAAGTASGRTDHNERIELRIRRDDSYSAEVGVGILDRLPTLLATRFPDTPVAVLTDDRVAELYGSKVAPILARAGIDPSPIIVPSGERSKTPATAEHVVEQLYRARFDRRSVLVNFGGGMITDLGGFVASTYLRGVAYVNVPTTLLSQHDSAIGGKVGVDTPWAKNFLGAFHHPCAVYCDPSVLQTLPIRELRSGLAESVKVAICGAPGLFEFLEDHAEQLLRADTALLEELVGRSIRGKVDILDPDPYEVDLRRSLNLGHTFGHALEVELGFAEVTHGEAVAHGLAVATMIGDALGLCRSDDVERIMALLDRFGLPPAIDEAKLKAAAKRIDDVRLVRAGQLNYVVPTSTHSVTILPTLSVEDVTAAIDAVGVFTRTARPADPAGSAAADG